MVETLGAITLVEWGIIATIVAACTPIAFKLFPYLLRLVKKKAPTNINAPVLSITGRDNEVKAIFDHFDVSQHPMIISGSPGIGKTVLAEAYAEYAQNDKRRYQSWVLLPLTSKSEMATRLSALAQGFDVIEADADRLIHRTFQAMIESGKRWLVILDNADSDDEVRLAKSHLIDHKNIDMIITSQRQDWPDTDCKSIPLVKLSDEDAVTLLMSKSGQVESQALRDLAIKTLQGLPLPITLAAADMKITGASPDTYQVDFDRMLKKDPGTGKYPKALETAIGLALDRLSVEARAFLNLAAYFHPDDIDPGHVLRGIEGIAVYGYDPLPEPLNSHCKTEVDMLRLIADCVNHSLLMPATWRDQNTYRLHRTTQAAIRAAQSLEQVVMNVGLSARLGAAQIYPNVQYDTARWPQYHRLAPHAVHLLDVANRAEGEDVKGMGHWLNQISLFIEFARGELDLVLKLRQAVVPLCKTAYGELSENYAVALGNLANIQDKLGRAAKGGDKDALDREAEAKYKRTIEIQKEIGSPPLDQAYHYNNLGNFYLRRQRFDLAEKNYQIALEIRQKNQAPLHLQGADHDNLGVLYSDWAESLRDYTEIKQRRDLALKHKRRGLQFIQDGLGPVHQEVAISHNSLAIEYDRVQDSDRSVTEGLLSVAILRLMCKAEQISPDHPMVTKFTGELSIILQRAGKSEAEGEALIVEAMTKLEAAQKDWEAKRAAS